MYILISLIKVLLGNGYNIRFNIKLSLKRGHVHIIIRCLTQGKTGFSDSKSSVLCIFIASTSHFLKNEVKLSNKINYIKVYNSVTVYSQCSATIISIQSQNITSKGNIVPIKHSTLIFFIYCPTRLIYFLLLLTASFRCTLTPYLITV